MDIKLPINSTLSITSSVKNDDSALGLKLNQIVEAKVVETQILLDTLSFKIAGKTVTAQTQTPISLQSGQSLQLQVIKLLPSPELRILSSQLPADVSQDSAQLPETLKLKLEKPAFPPIPIGKASGSDNQKTQFSVGQRFLAEVQSLDSNQLSLKLLNHGAQTNDSANPAKQRLNAPLLIVDKQQLLAGTNITPAPPSLKPGMTIELLVSKAGPTPLFVVTESPPPDQEIIRNAFKQLLPTQASAPALLNHLQQAVPRLQAEPNVAETLKNLALEILAKLPASNELSKAPQLKQSFENSGLFLESKLAALLAGKTDIHLKGDLKLKLSHLARLLEQELAKPSSNKNTETLELLKESLHKTQAALSRLTLEQLNALPKEESVKQSWTVELPYYRDQATDTVKITIEQHKAKDNDKPQKNWTVSITITPPNLGTMFCQLSCYDGSVNTRFWSESANTVKLIDSHLGYLKQQFEDKGITAGFMDVQQGSVSPSSSPISPLTCLLNEKA